MFQKYKPIIACMFCILLIGFTACSPNNTKPRDDNSADITKNYPVPQENRRGYDAQFSICPSSTSDGFYRVNSASKSMWYYDAESERGMFLCAQTGCAHDDETCQAWIGNATVFTEYHGDIFAIRQYEDESRDFIKKDLSTGKITVLKKWESFDGGYYEPAIGVISNNRVVLSLTRCAYNEDFGVIKFERVVSQLLYDLTTGETTEMLIDKYNNDEVSFTVMGLSDDNMAVWVAGYIDNKDTEEIRLYNLNTYEYTVLTDTDHAFIRPVFPNYVYDNQIVYAGEDTIYLFDLTTLEKRELIKSEGIVDYSIMDNRIFYTTGETGSYSFYYADIDKPVPVKQRNNNNTEVIQFSILYEGESFFISSDAIPKIISKKDFYAERYENAKTC